MSFARTDETNFDLIFALLRIGTHHQVIIIEIIIRGITTVIITGIITDILKGIYAGTIEGIFGRIFNGIFNGIFKGIYAGTIEGIIKGFFQGIIKGIILVSLRVIDGGFCLGNEFLTLRRGLRCIQDFFSDQLLELDIGHRVLGFSSIPCCRLECSPTPNHCMIDFLKIRGAGQAASKVTTGECEGEDDGWMNG